jgi:hypothetical protein
MRDTHSERRAEREHRAMLRIVAGAEYVAFACNLWARKSIDGWDVWHDFRRVCQGLPDVFEAVKEMEEIEQMEGAKVA